MELNQKIVRYAIPRVLHHKLQLIVRNWVTHLTVFDTISCSYAKARVNKQIKFDLQLSNAKGKLSSAKSKIHTREKLTHTESRTSDESCKFKLHLINFLDLLSSSAPSNSTPSRSSKTASHRASRVLVECSRSPHIYF
jgi:hypothetical protein